MTSAEEIETIIEAGQWLQALPDAEGLAVRVFEAARAREPRLRGGAALLLTDDDALQALNLRFRGKNKATNVLSFPSAEPGFLGDIAIAFETCAREAAEKNIPLSDHAAHLLAHGLLHLAGHDHIEEAQAEAMERLEAEILAALGVSNPYEQEELTS